MNFAPDMIVKVQLSNGMTIHGRVTSVDEHGDGRATFPASGSRVIVSDVIPEMVVEAFYFQGKGRYGV